MAFSKSVLYPGLTGVCIFFIKKTFLSLSRINYSPFYRNMVNSSPLASHVQNEDWGDSDLKWGCISNMTIRYITG